MNTNYILCEFLSCVEATNQKTKEKYYILRILYNDVACVMFFQDADLYNDFKALNRLQKFYLYVDIKPKPNSNFSLLPLGIDLSIS